MRFPMLPKDQPKFELFAAALKRANVLYVRVLLVLLHKFSALEWLLAFLHGTKDLKSRQRLEMQINVKEVNLTRLLSACSFFR